MGKTLFKKTSIRPILLVLAGLIAAALLLTSCGGGGYGGGSYGSGGMYGGSGGGMTPAPLAFTLSMPTNGATSVSKAGVSLTWNASTYATTYYVYLTVHGTAYSAPVAVAAPTMTSPTGALAASTEYDWYVVATDSSGMATSATFTFTTGP